MKKHDFGKDEAKYDANEELSWMNYAGLLDMEVEFNTAGRYGLTLLSAYEQDGKILIDIGSSDEKNLTLLMEQEKNI